MPRKYIGFNVYKVTLNSVIKYIGITSKTLKQRVSDHYYEAFKRNSNYVFHKAIRKYGNDLIFEVIENVDSWEKAKELEIQYIAHFETHISKNGYNSTLGGDGAYGVVYTAEQRAKNSLSKKGKYAGNKHPMWGKKHTPETLKKMSESKKGKPTKHFWVPIIDLAGNKYRSITEASKITGLKRRTINASLLKARPLRTGQQFFYIKDKICPVL